MSDKGQASLCDRSLSYLHRLTPSQSSDSPAQVSHLFVVCLKKESSQLSLSDSLRGFILVNHIVLTFKFLDFLQDCIKYLI